MERENRWQKLVDEVLEGCPTTADGWVEAIVSECTVYSSGHTPEEKCLDEEGRQERLRAHQKRLSILISKMGVWHCERRVQPT